MDTRLANAWRMTVNEEKFIETALDSNIRVDGRNPLEFRNITVKFGREDGSSDVQLGKTRVMGFVTAQLVQPYRDRPNEGSLSIYTEFSPMADPSFEPGRPGESAVELGRVVDRGLRESRAVDTESLCVLPGKLVWAIRVDLHIIDNGGNLVDAANIAALAALLTFRRPECTLGGQDGQEVIVHPPEVKEPLSLVVHHLPIAVTFAFFGSEGKMVVDPTYCEEAVTGARMTVTANANGDICAIQKAGGEGVPQSVILHCLHLASLNAESITKKIKSEVEVYNTERALRKIKRQSVSVANVSVADGDTENNKKPSTEKGDEELSRRHSERLKLVSETASISQSNDIDGAIESSKQAGTSGGAGNAKNFVGGLSSWDPQSKGVSDFPEATLATHGPLTCNGEESELDKSCTETELQKLPDDTKPSTSVIDPSEKTAQQSSEEKTLRHAVKAKNKRRKKSSSGRNQS